MVSEEQVDEHWGITLPSVLILVLVEDGLGVSEMSNYHLINSLSLNPCFSGGWSRRTIYTNTFTAEIIAS